MHRILLLAATASAIDCGSSGDAAPPTPAVPPAQHAAPAAAPPAAAAAAAKPVAAGLTRLTIKSLGITIDVPGKVREQAWGESDMGTPAVHLTAKGSAFELYLSNAANDRYDLTARERLTGSYYKYGIVPIRADQTKDGGFELEFSDSTVNHDGSRGDAEYGYHARIVLGDKVINCAMSTCTREQLDEVVRVCHTVALAK